MYAIACKFYISLRIFSIRNYKKLFLWYRINWLWSGVTSGPDTPQDRPVSSLWFHEELCSRVCWEHFLDRDCSAINVRPTMCRWTYWNQLSRRFCWLDSSSTIYFVSFRCRRRWSPKLLRAWGSKQNEASVEKGVETAIDFLFYLLVFTFKISA